jgi:OOP family OmpA-OmpF porin
MNRFAKSLIATGITALCCIAAPAHAQLQFGRMDTGLYLGAAAGRTTFRGSCDGVPAGVNCDDKDSAFRAFAGYQFTQNVGVELGYADLGRTELSVPGFGIGIKARGVDLVGVLSYPIGQKFGVYGKLGAVRTRVSASAPGFGASDTTTDLTYGFGGRFNFTNNLAARLEWQRYQSVGTDATGSGNIDLFTLGLLYGF